MRYRNLCRCAFPSSKASPHGHRKRRRDWFYAHYFHALRKNRVKIQSRNDQTRRGRTSELARSKIHHRYWQDAKESFEK